MSRIVFATWARAFALSLALSLLAGGVMAGDELLRGPEPDWIVVAPQEDVAASSSAATSEGLRVLLFDSQYRAGEGSESAYLRLRNQALSAQALPLIGTVAVVWSPASQTVTIHHIHVIRDGQTIDVLANQSFETLRREANLHQATLDGQLTAVLQPADLRVGDILDVAYSLESRDPVTLGHAEQVMDLNLPLVVDRLRYRASWPTARPVRVRAAGDWTPLTVRRRGDQSSIEVRLDAVQPVSVPDDVVSRLYAARRIELSDYRDWSDIAVLLKPLYDRARRLDAASPLHAEIARIKALSDDPAVQASAALRLVQDQVRYVALLMGEGALTPASADETWSQRLGDCKAKTALLLALLDGLGITAEPAAVSVNNGDGMNEGLPRMSAFNHVLVRVEIDGQVHWLDGARTGDRRLEDTPVPPYFWALPLTGPNAALEALTPPPLTQPQSEMLLALDASAGLQAPAAATGEMTLRGDGAAAIGAQMGLMSETQKNQGIRELWQSNFRDLTIAEVGSAYDAEANVMTFSMKGTMALTWTSDGLIPPGATYAALNTVKRADGPFRNAPYEINHPTYTRSEVRVRLPQGGEGFRTSGGEVDRTELAHHLRRHVSREGDTVVIEITTRSLATEISAAEADRVRAEEEARPWSPPRIFPPQSYRATDADRAAMAASTPTTADEWIERAVALDRAGDDAGAVEAADRAVALAPDDSNTWANRGVYRLQVGDRENAEADLAKAIDLDPSERIAMNGYAVLAMMDQQYQDAVVETSRALRQAPGDPFALMIRMQAYVALKQYDRALRDIDTLIANEPDEREWKAGKIAILSAAGREEEAERELDSLVEAYPDDLDILLAQSQARIKNGKLEAALETLNRLLPQFEDKPERVLVLRAEALGLLGRYDEMTRDMAATREFSGESASRLNSLCWLAGRLGVMLDQALADCDAALEITPGVAAILDSRALVLLQMGDAEGAMANYQAALTAEPDQAASLYGRGLARIALGDIPAGEADKAAAIVIDASVAEDFQHYPATPPAAAVGSAAD